MPKGAEAVTHAARIYVKNITPDSAILKIDQTKAFNSLRRDKMFLGVRALALQLYNKTIPWSSIVLPHYSPGS